MNTAAYFDLENKTSYAFCKNINRNNAQALVRKVKSFCGGSGSVPRAPTPPTTLRFAPVVSACVPPPPPQFAGMLIYRLMRRAASRKTIFSKRCNYQKVLRPAARLGVSQDFATGALVLHGHSSIAYKQGAAASLRQ